MKNTGFSVGFRLFIGDLYDIIFRALMTTTIMITTMTMNTNTIMTTIMNKTLTLKTFTEELFQNKICHLRPWTRERPRSKQMQTDPQKESWNSSEEKKNLFILIIECDSECNCFCDFLVTKLIIVHWCYENWDHEQHMTFETNKNNRLNPKLFRSALNLTFGTKNEMKKKHQEQTN